MAKARCDRVCVIEAIGDLDAALIEADQHSSGATGMIGELQDEPKDGALHVERAFPGALELRVISVLLAGSSNFASPFHSSLKGMRPTALCEVAAELLAVGRQRALEAWLPGNALHGKPDSGSRHRDLGQGGTP